MLCHTVSYCKYLDTPRISQWHWNYCSSVCNVQTLSQPTSIPVSITFSIGCMLNSTVLLQTFIGYIGCSKHPLDKTMSLSVNTTLWFQVKIGELDEEGGLWGAVPISWISASCMQLWIVEAWIHQQMGGLGSQEPGLVLLPPIPAHLGTS